MRQKLSANSPVLSKTVAIMDGVFFLAGNGGDLTSPTDSVIAGDFGSLSAAEQVIGY